MRLPNVYRFNHFMKLPNAIVQYSKMHQLSIVSKQLDLCSLADVIGRI